MTQQQTGYFGTIIVRLLVVALMIVASVGLVSTGAHAMGSGDETNEANGITAAVELSMDMVVVATDDLAFREGPGLDTAVLAVLAYGTSGTITDGPVAADGYNWYAFSSDNHGTGWVAGAFLAPIASDAGAVMSGDTLVVAGNDLNLRAEPGLTSTIVAALMAGTEVVITDGPVLADGYTWYAVSVPAQGSSGWAAGEFLAPSNGASGFELGDDSVVAADGLNLRDMPTLDGALIAQLVSGTPVLITGGPVVADGYNWYRITVDDGTDTTGWVAGEFLAYP